MGQENSQNFKTETGQKETVALFISDIRRHLLALQCCRCIVLEAGIFKSRAI